MKFLAPLGWLVGAIVAVMLAAYLILSIFSSDALPALNKEKLANSSADPVASALIFEFIYENEDERYPVVDINLNTKGNANGASNVGYFHAAVPSNQRVTIILSNVRHDIKYPCHTSSNNVYNAEWVNWLDAGVSFKPRNK